MRSLILLGVFAATCSAELPSNFVPYAEAKISLDAKTLVAGSKAVDDFKSGYGSYDKTWKRERSIELSAKSFASAQMDVVVRVYWIGKTIRGSERVILSQDK